MCHHLFPRHGRCRSQRGEGRRMAMCVASRRMRSRSPASTRESTRVRGASRRRCAPSRPAARPEDPDRRPRWWRSRRRRGCHRDRGRRGRRGPSGVPHAVHGSVSFEQRRVDAEDAVLHIRGVGHDAAAHGTGGTGHVDEGRDDQPAVRDSATATVQPSSTSRSRRTAALSRGSRTRRLVEVVGHAVDHRPPRRARAPRTSETT